MPRKSAKTPSPLRLEGPLDIQRAAERHADVAAAFAAAKTTFTVDLGGITSCDTAGLQLLGSARRSTTLQGRESHFINPSEAVLRACSAVGIQPEQLGL